MEIISLGSGDAPKKRRITDIRPALRDQNRVNIFVDDEYAFSLDIAQVIELGVKKGREISGDELEKLKSASEFGKLYQRALEWVLTRPHSIEETQDYLKRTAARRRSENKLRTANAKKSKEERQKYHLKTKLLPEISEDNMALVLERLKTRGYLDDKKFASFYLENRLVKKGVSQKRLKLELKGKGVSEENIEAAFSENPRNEEEEIRKIIAKKARKYDSEKLLQYLICQGFDYQLSKNLVHEMDSQNLE